MATITVDRATRDMLCEERQLDLSGDADSLEYAIEHAEWEKAHRLREQIEVGLRFLRALGWDADDPRSRYELAVDRVLADWLSERRRSLEGSVEYDRANLCRLEEGDEDYRIVGRTLEESVRIIRGNIGEHLTMLDTFDRLLGEVGEQIGAVA